VGFNYGERRPDEARCSCPSSAADQVAGLVPKLQSESRSLAKIGQALPHQKRGGIAAS